MNPCERKYKRIGDSMHISFQAFGTYNQIMTEEEYCRPLLEECRTLCEAIEAKFSAFQPTSAIAEISAKAGIRPVEIDEETFFMLKRAQDFSNLSKGAFDITIRPATAIWGIGKKRDYVPDNQDLELLHELVDYKGLILDQKSGTAMLQKAGQQIDLGGIAKGYAADRAMDHLIQNGCNSALINFGGNIATIGAKHNGERWQIGVQNPLAKRGAFIGTVGLADQTIVTSGVNERFFIRDGKRYHHILDPRTCCPADSSLLSVTVIGNRSIDMDALSTALFVLGPNEGAKLANQTGCHALFILTTREIFATEGFPKMLKRKV
jgi:thiamine biosynthesis lipoprotein